MVLLTVTVNFTNGFDMDKYVSNFTASDFIVANAGKFQNSVLDFTPRYGRAPVRHGRYRAPRGALQMGAWCTGRPPPPWRYITEGLFPANEPALLHPRNSWTTPIRLTSRNEAGDLAANVQLSGMSPFALDHLTVLEGDLSKLYEDGGKYVAAVYAEDDYGRADMDSHWARLGDTVTIRYVEEVGICGPGHRHRLLRCGGCTRRGQLGWRRPVKYRDVAYQVAALVTGALRSQLPGTTAADEFILNAQTFVEDTGTSSVMYYAFDTTDEANDPMEEFLQNYTENVNPELDYESKALYAGEFEKHAPPCSCCWAGP